MTKFLISVSVSSTVPAPEESVSTLPRQSRWVGALPAPASVLSMPRMETLIHLDFGSDEEAVSRNAPSARADTSD